MKEDKKMIMNLKDMSIKNKIKVISIIPLFFMVLFSFYIINSTFVHKT